MNIERIKIIQTLKMGGKLWLAGTIIGKPIPSELVAEAKSGSSAVEIISTSGPDDSTKQMVNTAVFKEVADAEEKAGVLKKILEDLEVEVKELSEKRNTLTTEVESLNETLTALQKKVADARVELSSEKKKVQLKRKK